MFAKWDVLNWFGLGKSEAADADEGAAEPERLTSALDVYTTEPPGDATALRIFEGAWSSYIPGYGFGTAALFQDHRVDWIAEQCGGFSGKRILELGPLEGGHTYMFARGGAASITSIESNQRAFLKCLVVKEILGFDARFHCGDFRPYLKTCEEEYDFVMASGVLYHMTEPLELLEGIARVSSSFAVWTHYYDDEIIRANEELSPKFAEEPVRSTVRGREIEMYEQNYLDAINWSGFCGGSAPTSFWMTRDSLLGAIADLGYEVTVHGDEREHPNGPAILFYAHR
ncbi:class I SAM-dependent methyltransferase [Nisaea sediminum]|uniref:class I SAM-dependent methyltransferase n=1 Tax=Nisaea sediminum TaxID=2775867 RepID=UPI001867639D|nr:class I SAM-dependent methyltransferase [Nisaea sediminum]